MSEYIQVVATLSSQADAERVAEWLVSERLAICTEVSGPTRSTFWRRGLIESHDRWHCIVKTRRNCYEAIEATIRMFYPHKTLEIVAVPIVEMNEEYRVRVDELDQPHGSTTS